MLARTELTPRPAPRTIVVKFGSSLLKDASNVPVVCKEIRRLSSGAKVVAVISAFHGETDRLFRLAGQLAAVPCELLLPKLVLSGEEQAACAVALGCAHIGLKADVIPISDLRLLASGQPLTATASRLDPWVLTQALESHDVVVVPGYGATCVDTGKHVLLGRGGSDMTATMIAASLKLGRVRLIKDVGGLYTRDPGKFDSMRLDRVDFARARQVAGKLIQAEAIECAERHGIIIEIACPGSDDPSVIGPGEMSEPG